jgi:hypothetical protein
MACSRVNFTFLYIAIIRLIAKLKEFHISNLPCSCELSFIYFRDQPDYGYTLAKTCSWLCSINKSCVLTEYIILLLIFCKLFRLRTRMANIFEGAYPICGQFSGKFFRGWKTLSVQAPYFLLFQWRLSPPCRKAPWIPAGLTRPWPYVLITSWTGVNSETPMTCPIKVAWPFQSTICVI